MSAPLISLTGFDPKRSELNKESLENLLLALTELKDKQGRRLNIEPTLAWFTGAALSRLFGREPYEFGLTTPKVEGDVVMFDPSMTLRAMVLTEREENVKALKTIKRLKAQVRNLRAKIKSKPARKRK